MPDKVDREVDGPGYSTGRAIVVTPSDEQGVCCPFTSQGAAEKVPEEKRLTLPGLDDFTFSELLLEE